MCGRAGVGLVFKLVLLSFSLFLLPVLGFGGLWGARFGNHNGHLALNVEKCLLQRSGPVSGSCSGVTFRPTTKLVLAVR